MGPKLANKFKEPQWPEIFKEYKQVGESGGGKMETTVLEQ